MLKFAALISVSFNHGCKTGKEDLIQAGSMFL